MVFNSLTTIRFLLVDHRAIFRAKPRYEPPQVAPATHHQEQCVAENRHHNNTQRYDDKRGRQ